MPKRSNMWQRTDQDKLLLEFAERHKLMPPPVPSGKPDASNLTIAERAALQAKQNMEAKLK